MKKMLFFLTLISLFTIGLTAQAQNKPKAPKKVDREFTFVNYQTNNTKQWLPGSIIVKKGETVKLTLINDVPSGIHGFYIPAFDVRVQIKKGEKKEVTFTADKAGLFDIKCHLHAAHIGGQILVTE